MSESENGNEVEAKRVDRERHKEIVDKVIKFLKEKKSREGTKLLRSERGERLESLSPEKSTKKCVAYCEAFILGDKESVQELRDQFGTGDLMSDPLSDAFKEAGYVVKVDYDHEKSSSEFDCMTYTLYESEKDAEDHDLKKAGYELVSEQRFVIEIEKK